MYSKEINIEDDYFFNILKHIKKYVPEFDSLFDYNEIYPIVFEFGEYLLANINNEELISRGVSFINEALEQGTHFTEDLIVLQIFQQFYNNRNASQFIKNKLSTKANYIFDKFYREYNKR